MKYPLCDNPWNEQEIKAIESVINTGMYTMGDNVKKMETLFAQKMGVQHAVMVNSGSSANLLAIAALIYSGRISRGDEVIVPAVSWSTTYAPLQQFGLKLVFVDINLQTLNMDIACLAKAITERTRMIFAVNLLGNPNQFEEMYKLIKGKNIFIAEDNCESLGGCYQGKMLGTLGIVGTYSSFYSHHICTMEGGFAVTDDEELYEYMLSIRAHGWTRNLPENSIIYKKKNDPFYESFNFIVPGYNLRPLEMEGAIGLMQMDKFDEMIARRRENAAYFLQQMKQFPDLQCQKETEISSWFGFAIILRNKLLGKRDQLIARLRENEIEVRPIVAGNFTRNEVIKYMEYEIPMPLVNADEIHDNGFFVGNHSQRNAAEVDLLVDVLKRAIAELAK